MEGIWLNEILNDTFEIFTIYKKKKKKKIILFEEKHKKKPTIGKHLKDHEIKA